MLRQNTENQLSNSNKFSKFKLDYLKYNYLWFTYLFIRMEGRLLSTAIMYISIGNIKND